VDHVRRSAGIADRPVQVLRADDVGPEPLVDRRVERHRGGAVKDHVEVRREDGGAVGEVTLEDLHPLLEHRPQPIGADAVPEAVERRPGQHRLHPGPPRQPTLGADQEHRPGLGDVRQDPLEHGLPEETGHAGDQDP
jgi:hypothetical protein